MRAYLLGIGLRPGVPVVRREKGPDPGFERRFIDNIHRDHGGVVVALSHRLEARDVRRLADAGVDGFEIANFGHPAPPEPVDRVLRDVARERGLPLVASSDWHGWGAYFRTWTLVKDAAAGTEQDLAGVVLDSLRAHRAGAVVPVVAGPMGKLTGWRAAAAPVAATVGYARGLSAVRLGAWWVWALGAWGLARAARRWVSHPAILLGALGLALGSVVFWWRGVEWLAAGAWGGTAVSFPTVLGCQVLGGALAALVAAGLLVRRAGWSGDGRRAVPEAPSGAPTRLCEEAAQNPSARWAGPASVPRLVSTSLSQRRR